MAAAAAILKMKLRRLRMEKPRIIRGADKQLKELEYELEDIFYYAYPRWEHRRLIEMDILRGLTSKAREMLLQCNFVIDTFISDIEVSIRRAGVLQKMFLRCVGKLKGLIKFKQEIGAFSREIGEIGFKMRIETLAFRGGQPKRARRGPPVVKESDVVGLEGDVEFLLNKAILKESDVMGLEAIRTDRLSTICIVGMGGIGKTTLASILYHHPAVAAHFELRVWITLSTELSDVDYILKELIAQLWKAIGSEGDEIFYQFSLKEQVCELLLGRKCFIVLDDAWDGTNSCFFLTTFPRDTSSALVVTSRKRDAIWGFSIFVHELKLLDAKKSWEMFSKKAFAGKGKCPKHLEEIGKTDREKV